MIKIFADAENIFNEVVAFRETVLKTTAEKTWHNWKKVHSYGVYDIGSLLLADDVKLTVT